MSTERRGGSRTWLLILGCALGAQALFTVIAYGLSTYQLWAGQHRGLYDVSGFDAIWRALDLARLAIAVFVVAALGGMASRWPGSARAWSLAAAVALGANALERVAWLAFEGREDILFDWLYRHFVWKSVAPFLSGFGLLCVALAIRAGYRALSMPSSRMLFRAVFSVAVIDLAWTMVRLLPLVSWRENVWLGAGLGLVLASQPALVAAWTVTLVGALDRSTEPPRAQPRGWTAVADGLRLFRRAILGRFALVAFIYAFPVWTLVAGWSEPIEWLQWVLPIGVVLIGVLTLVGLGGFAAQPNGGPVRRAAWVAFALTVTALVADWHSLVLLRDSVGEERLAWGSASAGSAAGRAQAAAVWASILGFFAHIASLVALGKLSGALERPALRQRAVNLGVLIVVLGVFVLALRSWPSSGGAGTLLGLGCLLALGALIAAIRYIALLGAVEQAVRETRTANQVELPLARLL